MLKSGPKKDKREIIELKSKKAKTETSRKDLFLRLDNLVLKEAPTSPNGSSLPSPCSPHSPTYQNLSPKSKLERKAEFHNTPLPKDWSNNRTPELARRQMKAAVYHKKKQGSVQEWQETYGSDIEFPGDNSESSSNDVKAGVRKNYRHR